LDYQPIGDANQKTPDAPRLNSVNGSTDGHTLVEQAGEHQREIDDLDLELLNLLQLGFDNKKIAKKTDSPLSTVQRRTRLIFERGFATSRVELDYAKLGYRKGFLMIALKGGQISKIVDMLQKLKGIISVSANIGNFPIICTIAYHRTEELWELLSKVQEMDNVKDAVWSEQIYSVTTDMNIIDLQELSDKELGQKT
jgi:DNA-binding Lrp family transcriptional regulator